MRKRWLGLLLGILVLSTAPGCRTAAAVGIVAGWVAVEFAAARYSEPPPCDYHSAAPPTHRCR